MGLFQWCSHASGAEGFVIIKWNLLNHGNQLIFLFKKNFRLLIHLRVTGAKASYLDCVVLISAEAFKSISVMSQQLYLSGFPLFGQGQVTGSVRYL